MMLVNLPSFLLVSPVIKCGIRKSFINGGSNGKILELNGRFPVAIFDYREGKPTFPYFNRSPFYYTIILGEIPIKNHPKMIQNHPKMIQNHPKMIQKPSKKKAQKNIKKLSKTHPERDFPTDTMPETSGGRRCRAGGSIRPGHGGEWGQRAPGQGEGAQGGGFGVVWGSFKWWIFTRKSGISPAKMGMYCETL